MLWLGTICSELEMEYFTTSVSGAGADRIGPKTATGAEKETERRGELIKSAIKIAYILCTHYNFMNSI